MDLYSAETSGKLIDVAESVTTGAALLAGAYGAARGVHCNVSGTYRLYGSDATTYVEFYLVAGGLYPYITTKITDTNGSALTDNAVAAVQ